MYTKDILLKAKKHHDTCEHTISGNNDRVAALCYLYYS